MMLSTPQREFRSSLVLATLVLVITYFSGPQETPGQSTDAQIEFFERRIRPVLVAECYECHGPQRQEGSLRVDFREALRVGGDLGPALVPADAKNSLLLQVIAHQHDDIQMPKGRKKLSPDVIADFESWIANGAADPRDQPADDSAVPADWPTIFAARSQWWSLQPVAPAALPMIADSQWPRQPIDQFILAKLEAHQLRPARPASPTEWLRRVNFAIIGLPPTPEEVEAFLHDSSPLARQQVVERLLASPHFGERWARHWMDLVRFAESYGHEQDYEIPYAWRYRDYLIRAYNDDVPYDQFVREHVAGDLLDEPRIHPSLGFNESVIATGFWYMHQATHAPVDPQQDEADRIDNQLDVFGKTFLGLTVACARCHDHKFDAISTRDYYSLTAFLRSARQDIRFLDGDGRLNAKICEIQQHHEKITELLRQSLERNLNERRLRIKDYLMAAHEVTAGDLSTVSDTANSDRLTERIQECARNRSLDDQVLKRWIDALASPALAQFDHPLHSWYRLAATAKKTEEPAPIGSSDPLPADQPAVVTTDVSRWFSSGSAFELMESGKHGWRIAGSHIELLPANLAHSGRLADELPGVLRSPTFKLTKKHLHLRVAGTGGKVRLVICRYTLRNFNPLLFGETLFDVKTEGQYEWRSLGADIRRYQGLSAYLELIDEGAGTISLDRLVLSDSEKPPRDSAGDPYHATSLIALAAEIESSAYGQLDAWRLGADESDSLQLVHWMSRQGLIDWGDAQPEIAQQIESYRKTCSADFPEPMRVLAMAAGSPEETRVFTRGDYKHPGEPVVGRFLEALSTRISTETQQGSSRRELAEALISADNRLLYRVYVNRVWAHLFGRGLVATVDNFGAMGKLPTHPELLDYLSDTFRRSGMSTKSLIQTLCLSQTFAMSSTTDDGLAAERDPENELIHRQRLSRLEGEVIRDSLLAVSGNMESTLFGPSILTHLSPYMGDPYWLTSRGIRSGPLDGDRRRSIYLETRRNFLSPWMLTFDGVIPDTTVGQRNVSNIPAQSLALMNDPFVQQQAVACAQWLLRSGDIPAETRISQLYIRALGRPVEAEELHRWMAFLQSQSKLRQLTPTEAAADERLWSDMCHIVFMLKEFIFVR